jgi:hypothetical protein
MKEVTASSNVDHQRTLLRIGALCAILGPILLIASLAPHGDLPTDDAKLLGEVAAMRFVADHPLWYVLHLGTMVAGVLWLGAFAALAGTLAPGRASALGHLLVPSAVLGAVFVVFDYGVDGFAFKMLAGAWAAAPPAEQAQLQLMADTAAWFLNGTFRSEIGIFYGLTVLLAGLAVAHDGRYPRWFGRIAALAGGLVLLNALVSLAGIRLTRQDFLLFVTIVPIESIWLVALGVMMWRRAGRVSA